VVQLTQAGEATFLRLQQAAIACHARLRAGPADADLDNLSDLPGQLPANAGRTEEGAPPWAGLAESRRQKCTGSAPPTSSGQSPGYGRAPTIPTLGYRI
jgi:hypothetical protein